MTRWVCTACWHEERAGVPEACPSCGAADRIWWSVVHGADPRHLAHIYLAEELPPASPAVH